MTTDCRPMRFGWEELPPSVLDLPSSYLSSVWGFLFFVSDFIPHLDFLTFAVALRTWPRTGLISYSDSNDTGTTGPQKPKDQKYSFLPPPSRLPFPLPSFFDPEPGYLLSLDHAV